jgi:hypothetical protein
MVVFELHILNHDGQSFTQLCTSDHKARWLLLQHVGLAAGWHISFDTHKNSGIIKTDGGDVQWYITEMSVI